MNLKYAYCLTMLVASTCTPYNDTPNLLIVSTTLAIFGFSMFVHVECVYLVANTLLMLRYNRLAHPVNQYNMNSSRLFISPLAFVHNDNTRQNLRPNTN